MKGVKILVWYQNIPSLLWNSNILGTKYPGLLLLPVCRLSRCEAIPSIKILDEYCTEKVYIRLYFCKCLIDRFITKYTKQQSFLQKSFQFPFKSKQNGDFKSEDLGTFLDWRISRNELNIIQGAFFNCSSQFSVPKWNIAKGTTDPRVEFVFQDHSSQFTNLEHITISESRLSINFKISTKHLHFD